MYGGLRHFAECRREGTGCFGAGCHIRRGVAELAKQVAIAVTLGAGPDNERGMPTMGWAGQVANESRG